MRLVEIRDDENINFSFMLVLFEIKTLGKYISIVKEQEYQDYLCRL